MVSPCHQADLGETLFRTRISCLAVSPVRCRSALLEGNCLPLTVHFTRAAGNLVQAVHMPVVAGGRRSMEVWGHQHHLWDRWGHRPAAASCLFGQGLPYAHTS